MQHQCQFCNKEFSSKSNLTAHLSKAKYCISKRNNPGEISVINYKCDFCKKSFTSKHFLLTHSEKCRAKTLYDQNTLLVKRLEDQNIFFENKLHEQNTLLLKRLEDQNILYENKLQKQKMLLQEKDNGNLILQKQVEHLQNKIVSIALEGYNYKKKYEENLQQAENKSDSPPITFPLVEGSVDSSGEPYRGQSGARSHPQSGFEQSEWAPGAKPQSPKEDFSQSQEEKDPALFLKDSYKLVYRPEDSYIDVTNLCKAGGKEYYTWKGLKRTRSFLQVLSSSLVVTIDELLKYQIGSNSERKTWVHPQVAINIAQWISQEFDVKVSRWIYQILLIGKIDIRDSKTTLQLDQLSKENKKYAEKIELLERKYIQRNKRVRYTDQSVLYIITTESRGLKKEYKIGKTQDLTNRLSSYNTTEDHKVVFYIECETQDEMNTLEKIVFVQLNHLRIQVNREWFCGEVDEMIRTIKDCKDFITRK